MRLRRLRRACGCCLLACVVACGTRCVDAQQHTAVMSQITGRVLDATGQPVRGAVVTLRTAKAEKQVETDAAGTFVFAEAGRGPFRLTAAMQGAGSASLEVAEGTAQPIVLSLKKDASASAGEIAFSDAPNFTVAGVTDWTAVGGHGSDATLRTSEDLARSTAALGSAGLSAGADDRAAEQKLQEAVKAAPRDYAANLALGEYYLHAAQYARSVPVLQVASAEGGARPQAEYDLALACRGVGDLHAAKQHVMRSLQAANKAEYHRLAGEIEEASGDPYAAVQQMERAVLLDPAEANYFAWGSELLLHRAILQASQIFERGAAKYPDSARLHTGWGTALFAEARYEEAAQQLGKAADLQPREAEPYVVLGKADAASPTPLPGVVERLERHLKLEPQDARAHLLLAEALLKRGIAENAMRPEALLHQAVALDAKSAEAYLELGKMAAARKQNAEAMALYQKAIAVDPQMGEAHFRLAVLYERAGKTDDAQRERALHAAIEQKQADTTEQERRSLKQFLVVLQGSPAK